MSSSHRRQLMRLAVAVILWPACAEAQTAAQSFADLIRVLSSDETIVVTDTVGRTVKGKLATIDENSLSLSADGQLRTFAESEIRSVRLPDGIGDGALIGAGAGFGAALGILGILGSREGYVLPSAKAGAPVLLSGIGALVGALIDRAHDGGRVLYESRATASSWPGD